MHKVAREGGHTTTTVHTTTRTTKVTSPPRLLSRTGSRESVASVASNISSTSTSSKNSLTAARQLQQRQALKPRLGVTALAGQQSSQQTSAGNSNQVGQRLINNINISCGSKFTEIHIFHWWLILNSLKWNRERGVHQFSAKRSFVWGNSVVAFDWDDSTVLVFIRIHSQRFYLLFVMILLFRTAALMLLDVRLFIQ